MVDIFSDEWFEARRNRKIAYTPDKDPVATYAAVGFALSEWEKLEQALADIYAAVRGKPNDLEFMLLYANAGRTFTGRMCELESAASAHFVSSPSQEMEGSLGQVIADIRGLSNKRHRAAHGVVMPRVMEWSPDGEKGADFRLVPPFYAMHQLSKPEVMFYYGSAEIHAFGLEFRQLAEKVRAYRDKLITSL